MSLANLISETFGKFVGREVQVDTKILDPGKNRGKRREEMTPFNTKAVLNENDPVVREMQQAAEQAGFAHVTVWTNDSWCNTADTTRVNAFAQRGQDGKWRITPKFTMG